MRDWITTHARTAYWIWVALSLPVVALLRAGGFTFPAIYAVCLCWIAGGWFLINFGVSRRLRAAVRTLEQDCDPEPLLELCRTVTAQNPKSVIYRLDGGLALLLLGRREEAAAELAGLEDNRRIWKNSSMALSYCSCRLDLAEDLEEAAAWLDRMEAHADKKPATARMLEGQRACLALRRGETQGLEPIFLAALERAATARMQVAWRWELAALCRMEGREAEAREHLEYVAAHGNKLYMKAGAERLLAQLG